MKDILSKLIEWLIPVTVGTVFMAVLALWLRPDLGETLLRLLDGRMVHSAFASGRVRAGTEMEGAELKAGSPTVKREVEVVPTAEPAAEPMVVIRRAVSLPSPLLQPIGPSLDAEWTAVAAGAGLPVVYAWLVQGAVDQMWAALEAGEDVNARTAAGDTALGWAMRHGEMDRFRDLIHWGADLEALPLEGQPLLVIAAIKRQEEAMDVLLRAGSDVDVRSRRPVGDGLLEEVAARELRVALERDGGLTPLMVCVARGDVTGAQQLLSAGAARSVHTDRYKKYPINFAAEQQFTYLMQLLLGRQPGDEMEQSVEIDLSEQRARILRDGRVFATTSVSTGKKGYRTPTGTFVITNKHRAWTSTLYDASMPYFMRLNCGAIGLHAGNVPGYPASHGCIRLPSSKAREWFGYMRLGDVVQIVP